MAAAKKKRVRYVGPARRQTISLPDGTEIYCSRDQSVEVPASIAQGLLEQSIWKAAGGGSKQKEEDS